MHCIAGFHLLRKDTHNCHEERSLVEIYSTLSTFFLIFESSSHRVQGPCTDTRPEPFESRSRAVIWDFGPCRVAQSAAQRHQRRLRVIGDGKRKLMEDVGIPGRVRDSVLEIVKLKQLGPGL